MELTNISEQTQNVLDVFGINEPVKPPVEKKTDKVRVYIGVNSDDTAIISTVPLVRFENMTQADEARIAYSFNDSRRPPHWIPQDNRSHDAKYGEGYTGEYINVNKALATKLAGADLSWEDNYVLTLEL